MKFAIYQGNLVEVEKVHETFITITTEYGSIIVDREKLMPIPESIINEVISELNAIKIQITDLVNRMYRLENEYQKKMEALRVMYLDARSEEMKVVNRIIKNSQITYQK